MPGVNVTTAVRTGPVGTGDIVAGQFFVVGETERGPIDEPTLLRSFAEFVTYYGDYESGNLYSTVKTYFDEGGTRVYVQRVVGAGASAGTITVDDDSDVATMDINAKNEGDWSDNVTVVVTDSDSLVGGFRLQVKLNGELLLTTRDLADVADAANVINTSQVAHLIEVVDNDTSDNNPSAGEYSLAGGDDGASVSASDVSSALDLLPKNLGPGAVSAPGRNGTDIWNALATHAQDNDRIAICGFASNATEGEAKTAVAGYASDSRSSYMAFYHPHIKVDSPSVDELAAGTTSVSGTTVTISPEAFAAAARSKAVQEVGGPWRAGAGQISSAKTIKGLGRTITPAAAELLDAARVNAIRTVGNQIRVYGARSASEDEANWRFITLRDTVNYIVHGVEDRLEAFVFETVDGRGNLFANMRASIKGFLEPIRVEGGLYEAFDDEGVQVDPGYTVTVDSTINPATQLATGLVKAAVGVRVSSVADKINITITKSNLTAPV